MKKKKKEFYSIFKNTPFPEHLGTAGFNALEGCSKATYPGIWYFAMGVVEIKLKKYGKFSLW